MMKLCKIIRIITVAPLAAALAVTLLFLHGGFFANGANFAAAIISLTFFPLLAYTVSLIKKGDERRRFQRSLAIVLAVAGYIGGLLFSLAANAADGERVLYLTYLLSGVAIAFSSFVLKKKYEIIDICRCPVAGFGHCPPHAARRLSICVVPDPHGANQGKRKTPVTQSVTRG